MNIKLNKPYKIISEMAKRYEVHYSIPASHALIVPLRSLGDEVSCDVRWEDSDGEVHVIQHKVFVSENIAPINPLAEEKLYELWKFYYGT